MVEGTKPNLKKINEYVDRSLMLVTALSPVIGYDKASKIAHYAMDNDLTLKVAALELGFVTEAEFDRVVDPRNDIGGRRTRGGESADDFAEALRRRPRPAVEAGLETAWELYAKLASRAGGFGASSNPAHSFHRVQLASQGCIRHDVGTGPHAAWPIGARAIVGGGGGSAGSFGAERGLRSRPS